MKLLYFGEKNEFTQVLGKFLINDGYEFVMTEGKVPIIDITKKYIPDLILVDSSLSIISHQKRRNYSPYSGNGQGWVSGCWGFTSQPF